MVTLMFAVVNVGFAIDLARLAHEHSADCVYDANMRPELWYTMRLPSAMHSGGDIKLRIWSTGTVRFERCHSPDALELAWQGLRAIIGSYRY